MEKFKSGVGIWTSDKAHIDELVALYKIKMKEEDSMLHDDNYKEKVWECPWDAKVLMTK